jgi:hypothetical protein
MPSDMSWGDQIWVDIDKGFRFLFFDSYWGWILVALIVAVMVRKIIHAQRVG